MLRFDHAKEGKKTDKMSESGVVTRGQSEKTECTESQRSQDDILDRLMKQMADLNTNITAQFSAQNASITEQKIAMTNITEQLSAQKTEITEQFSAQNASITEQKIAMTNITEQLSAQKTEITEQLSAQNTNLTGQLSAQKTEITDQMTAINTKLDAQQTEIADQMAAHNVELTNKIATLSGEISTNLADHIARVDTKLYDMEVALTNKLSEYQVTCDESSRKLEAGLEQHKLEVVTLNMQMERVTTSLTVQESNITTLNQNVSFMSQEVVTLKSSVDIRVAEAAKELQSQRALKIEQENKEMRLQIEQLAAAYNNGNQPNSGAAKTCYYREGKVKKFGGTILENPIEHLQYLKSILSDIFWTDREKLRVAETSLIGAALLWWRTTYQDFPTFQQFEQAFRTEFWSIPKQCEIRTRLYAERYNENGQRSLEEHFVLNWERSRHMQPQMEDTEFICMFVSQLPLRLQNLLLRAHRGTISQLREDVRKLDQLEWVQEQDRRFCDRPRRGTEDNRDCREEEQIQDDDKPNFYPVEAGHSDGDNNRASGVSQGITNSQKNGNSSNDDYQPPFKRNKKYRKYNKNTGATGGEQTSAKADNKSEKASDCLAYCIPNDLRSSLLEEEEEKVPRSTQFNLELSWHIWDREVMAVLDTGATVSCISEQLFLELQQEFKHLPVLPVPQTCIVGASGKRSASIHQQVLLNLRKGKFQADWGFLVVKALSKPLIIGMDFIMKHVSVVDFEHDSVTLKDARGEPVDLGLSLGSNLEEKSLYQLNFKEEKEPAVREQQCVGGRDQPDVHPTKEEFLALTTTMDHLTGQQKEELLAVLWEHRLTFSEVPGRHSSYMARIKLTEERPFFQRSYPIPLAYREDVEKQIRQMLDWDIIERCASPYASPLCCVVKKDSTVRLCLDARQLNLRIVKDRESPTPPEEILKWCEEVRVLSSTDLTHGYWQLSLHPDDRKYVAFLYKARSYCFKVLPFGIANAVAEFTRCMDGVLGPECQTFARAYLDDIIIHSRSFKEHLQHLRSVFTKIKSVGMTLKLKKSLFCREEMPFLGYIVTPLGIVSDPKKLKVIQDFPVPRNSRQLKGFLGILGFYRKFSMDLADVTEPLFALLKKGTRWKWSVKEEEAFKGAKLLFVTSCTLHHPIPSIEFVLTTDASSYALGAKLSQYVEGNERVISMNSRLLNSAERHYTVTEKECLAFVWALQRFRSIVLGSPLQIRTDHKALTFMLSCRIHSSRIRRWILAIQEFDFNIVYVRGDDNQQVDALSRHLTGPNGRLMEEDKCAPPVYEVLKVQLGEDPALEKEFRKLAQLQREDPMLRATITIIESPDHGGSPAEVRIRSLYKEKEGVLYRLVNGKDPFYQHWKVCVPAQLQSKLMWYIHHKNGHVGARKCYWQAQRFFYWNNMDRHFRREIATCEVCQKVKFPNASFAGSMQPIIPEGPNMLVSVDIFGPLPVGQRGLRYLLVFLDCFSKFCRLYPLSSATSASCLKKVTKYVNEMGTPRAILTDHGTQFISQKWYEGLKDLKIIPTHSSIRHPASNPVERSNREIGRILRTYCHQKHTTWPAYVSFMNVLFNNLIQESTGQTPVSLHFGRAADYDWTRRLCKVEEEQLPEHQLLIESAKKKMVASAQRRGKHKKNPHVFHVGDLVLLKERPASNFFSKETKKLFLVFSGPYTITKVVKENAFELLDEQKQQTRGVFNAENLRPFKTLPNATV